MREVQLRDAKAGLSKIVNDAIGGEETIITRHGRRDAVVISYLEYERLKKIPSFGEMLAQSPLEDGDLYERRPARMSRDTDV